MCEKKGEREEYVPEVEVLELGEGEEGRCLTERGLASAEYHVGVVRDARL